MPEGSWPARFLKSLIKPALWLLVALLLLNFSLQIPAYSAQRRGEFVSYLVSSQAIAAGHGAAHFYDDDLFHKEIADLGYEERDIFYPNPPTTALLFLPLSDLDFQTARRAWVILSLLFLTLAVSLQFKELKLAGTWSLIALTVVLISQPLRADLRHGQIYTFMLLLATLTWVGFRRNRQIVAGIAFAGLIATKLFALPLYLLFLLRRHWKAIWVSLISMAVIVLASLPLLTPEAWMQFLRIPQRMLYNTNLYAVTAYQSLQSLIRHLFTFDPFWNAQPILNSPPVATILIWASYLLIISLTMYAMHVSKDVDLSFAAFITLSVFLSPFSQDYAYTVLLLPIVILIAYLREKPSTRLILIAMMGILLFASNLPFKSPRLTPGFWALLAYPKLYAGVIIWSLLIWLAIIRRTERKSL